MTIILGNLDNWKLDPLGPVSPQLRLILRSRILRNNLKPGEKISEPALAKLYNVSRQPVREAFITLVNEGLLEIRPQRGTLVKKIDYEVVLNGRFIREAIEADIVKTLVRSFREKPDPDLIKQLRKQIEDQKKVSNNSPEHWIALDEKFHQTIANAAGLRKTWSFLEAIKSQMDRVRFFTIEEFPIKTLIEQHIHLVDCIEQQNLEGADGAMRIHLREILKTLPKVQELYPDYFENSRELGP